VLDNFTIIRRVLIVWPEYPPSIGGMQVQGEALAWYLASQGIEVTVVCDSPCNPAEWSSCAEYDATSPVIVLRKLIRSEFNFSLNKLKEIATATSPDVVYCSHLALSPAFEGIAPVVCRSAANDVLRSWFGPYNISAEVMNALSPQEQKHRIEGNKSWCKTAAKTCRVLICNTRWTNSKLQFLSIPTFEVITGGVDTMRFVPNRGSSIRKELGFLSSDFLALVAGRHVKKKSYDLAIKAISLCNDTHIKLVIVGDGAETNFLKSLTRDLNLNDRVRFIGRVSHSKMPELISSADVLLAPSTDAYDPLRFEVDYESMGRVLLEASSCQLPVIASRTAGIPEVVFHDVNGLLVEPGCELSLATAVSRLANDPSLCMRLGLSGRKLAVERFCFSKVNSATLRVLCQVLPQGGKSAV